MTQIAPLDPIQDQFPKNPKRLLLFGPPGTGKTRACLETFLLPALRTGTTPDRILSCSFTRAAAGELRERLALATNIEDRVLRPTCSTIHAEALRTLRRPGQKIELVSAKKLADEDEGAEPEDATGEAGETWATGLMANVEAQIARDAASIWHLARAMCRREDAAVLADRLRTRSSADEIVAAIEAYEKAKRQKDLLDFTDLLEKALCEVPRARRLLIVDEVQDCSELQWRLIEHWASAAESVVFVGDPDQTIHEWCGAEYPRFFAAMENCELRRLTQSYRVPAVAHRMARKLILRVADRVDAPYFPAPREGQYDLAIGRGEVRDILIREIRERASRIFVLSPTVKKCIEWANLCDNARIPARLERGKREDPFHKTRRSLARALVALRANARAAPADIHRLVGKLPVRGSGLFAAPKTRVLEILDAPFKAETLSWEMVAEAGVNLWKLREAPSLFVAADTIKIADEGFVTLIALLEEWGPAVLNAAYQPPVAITTWHGSKGREADVVVIDLSPCRFVEFDIARGHQDRWLRALYVATTRAKRLLVHHDFALRETIENGFDGSQHQSQRWSQTM